MLRNNLRLASVKMLRIFLSRRDWRSGIVFSQPPHLLSFCIHLSSQRLISPSTLNYIARMGHPLFNNNPRVRRNRRFGTPTRSILGAPCVHIPVRATSGITILLPVVAARRLRCGVLPGDKKDNAAAIPFSNARHYRLSGVEENDVVVIPPIQQRKIVYQERRLLSALAGKRTSPRRNLYAHPEQKVCASCHCTRSETPMFRTLYAKVQPDPKVVTLCNACGLRVKKGPNLVCRACGYLPTVTDMNRLPTRSVSRYICPRALCGRRALMPTEAFFFGV